MLFLRLVPSSPVLPPPNSGVPRVAGPLRAKGSLLRRLSYHPWRLSNYGQDVTCALGNGLRTPCFAEETRYEKARGTESFVEEERSHWRHPGTALAARIVCCRRPVRFLSEAMAKPSVCRQMLLASK